MHLRFRTASKGLIQPALSYLFYSRNWMGRAVEDLFGPRYLDGVSVPKYSIVSRATYLDISRFKSYADSYI